MKAGFANCGHNFWWREFKFASFLYAHTSASGGCAHSMGLLRLGLCSGDYPGRAGFWPRQSAVPSRAHKSLSLST